MIPDGTSPNAIVLALASVLFVFSLLAMAFFWDRLPEPLRRLPGLVARLIVKRLDDNRVAVMSRDPISDAPSTVSAAMRQTGTQTPDRRMIPAPTREQMLDIFKVLRAANIKRETIAGPWRAAGLPLDTNLWSAAAPDDDTHITPIAGRRTSAQFESDPDYPYVAPPR